MDQGLTDPERAAVTAHVAACDDCRLLVANVLRTTDAVREAHTIHERKPQTLVDVRPARRQWARWAGGALAAAAALLLVVRVQPGWLLPRPGEDAGDGLAGLARAVGEQRMVEGRLSGGFAYGPLRAPVRSGGSTAARDNYLLFAAVGKIREVAEREPIAANLHAMGVAHLFVGEYDEAIRALEDATSEEPGNGRLQSDLAAAYLARATASDRPDDLTRALTGAERAVAADQALLEARFNRALALERLYLSDQARRAWREYLELDPSSGWADEARRHLEQLGPEDSRPDLARNNSPPAVTDTTVEAALDWLLQRGLPDLADAVLANDPTSAAAKRSSLIAYAESITHVSGDPFAVAVVPSGEITPATATGISRLADGLNALQAEDLAKADALFASACRVVPEPMASLCGLQLARYALQHRNRGDAEAYKERALSVAREQRYAYLEGYALRFEGYTEAYSARLIQALQPYRDAFAVFDRAKYFAQMGFVANELANTLDFTGVVDEASKWRQLSLRSAAVTRVPRLEYVTRLSAATVFSTRRQHEASRVFAEAIGEPNAAALPPLRRLNRELRRAQTSIALGDLNRAREAAESASVVLNTSSDYRVQPMRSDLLTELGEIAIAENRLDAADANLTAAIDLMGPERGIQRATALLRRAGVRVRRSQYDLAEADVAQALALLGERAAGSSWQPLYLDDARAAHEAIGDLVGAQPALQGLRGLHLVERLRELLDGVPPTLRLTSPASMNETIARLRPGQAILCYLFARDANLLAWVVQPGQQVAFVRLPVSGAEIQSVTNALTVRITRAPEREDDWRAALAELYDRLLHGLPSLDAVQELIVIPDGVLNRVPFGSLYDARTGQYVFQHRAVSLASSLVFALGSSAHASVSPASPSALVIGEPALSGSVSRDFARLPRARLEATAVAALYAKATLLVGDHATKGAVLENLGGRDVMHFAGHALASTDLQHRPRLLLAGAIEDPATGLGSSDLTGRRTTMPRRVVLAACETGAAPVDRAAGVASLAAGFLRAGAASVAATLWPVEDAQSQQFFLVLHKGLIAGDSMARAVARAQQICRASVQCREAATTWVGTTAYGSS
jgi:CHAT domain-containing protein